MNAPPIIMTEEDHRLYFKEGSKGKPGEFIIDIPLSVGDKRFQVIYIQPRDLPHVFSLLEEAWESVLGWHGEIDEGKPPREGLTPWSVIEKDHALYIRREKYGLRMLGYTEDNRYQFAVDIAVEGDDGKPRHLAQLGYLEIPIVVNLLKEAAK